jgi:hypothetical protein
MAQGKHPSSRRYPPEVKERAVQLVLTTIDQNGERHGVVSRIARQLDIGSSVASTCRQGKRWSPLQCQPAPAASGAGAHTSHDGLSTPLDAPATPSGHRTQSQPSRSSSNIVPPTTRRLRLLIGAQRPPVPPGAGGGHFVEVTFPALTLPDTAEPRDAPDGSNSTMTRHASAWQLAWDVGANVERKCMQ